MIDITWKLFSQTGNIEAYLLLKELEDGELADADVSHNVEPSTIESKDIVYKPH